MRDVAACYDVTLEHYQSRDTFVKLSGNIFGSSGKRLPKASIGLKNRHDMMKVDVTAKPLNHSRKETMPCLYRN